MSDQVRTLRELVVTAAGMPEDELRQTRRDLDQMTLDPEVRKLGVFVLDVFLEAGPNPGDRAAAVTRCLAACDEMERKLGGGGVSGTRKRAGGCATVLLGLLLLALVLLL